MDKKDKKKLIIIGSTALVICIVIIVIMLVRAQSPDRKISELALAGERYLSELDYEQAIASYQAILEIDPMNVDAYLCLAEAYRGLGDYPRAIEVQEEGFQMTESIELKEHLIKDYQKTAGERNASDAWEEVLAIYDRLLELDAANMETINGLRNCLNQYIELLMEGRQYDRIRELAEKYGDAAAGVDFKSILAKIQELEQAEAENRTFMQKVYDLMAAEDYEGMWDLDGSEEAEAFVERMEGDRFLYFPDDNASQSGIGAGIYTYTAMDVENWYYFYYGSFENGERRGTGTKFGSTERVYYVFAGAWDKDAPNGQGVCKYNGRFENNTPYNVVERGFLIDGLWDGDVEYTLTDLTSGLTYDLSYSAEKGIPTSDRTEEYLRYYELPEGVKSVYGFDYRKDANRAGHLYYREGDKCGIAGFTE